MLMLADRIANIVMTIHADPAAWLLEARRLCDRAGLSPARAIVLPGTLAAVARAIVEEAQKQGRFQQLDAAVTAMEQP